MSTPDQVGATNPLEIKVDTRLTFTNPLITSLASSPDPWITCRDGYYYFCASVENELWVWKSETISGLDHSEKKKVWIPPSTGPNSQEVWAPELHFIGERWYIYYAASDGHNANHRMYVLESADLDPQGEYLDKGKITSPDDRWAIDGTVLVRADGTMYFIWSGWPGETDGLQNLYIAPMTNPWTIGGERVLLSTPALEWEGWINEGPQVLQRNGLVFVIYSANASWTSEYCLGLLTLSGADPLNPAAWTKQPLPVFQKFASDNQGVYCVGHCSFTTSPDQREDWILYHGKDTVAEGWIGRQTRAQKFDWHADGTPNFGQPALTDRALPIPAGEIFRPGAAPSKLDT